MAEIRYHLDEHMDTAVAVGLRRRGIDAITTIEAGLSRASDQEQLAFALAEKRVFVTRDRRIFSSANPSGTHAGTVIARSGRGLIGPTVLALANLHRISTAENIVDQMIYL